jgi:Spy/CpxP family protein refolding chaperone
MRTVSVTPLSDVARGKEKNVTGTVRLRSSPYETSAMTLTQIKGTKNTMKRNLLILAATGAIALSGFAIVQAEDKPGFAGQGGHGHRNPLKHMTEALNLTPEQQAKVQPILDQAKPQLKAIHQEAMQKTKAIMDSTMTQIRPLLNAQQQKKLDDLKAAHEQMRDAMKKMHDAGAE